MPGRFHGHTTSATQHEVLVNDRVHHRKTVIFNEDTASVCKLPLNDLSGHIPDLKSIEAAAPAAPLQPIPDNHNDVNITHDHPANRLSTDTLHDAEIELLGPPAPLESAQNTPHDSPIRFLPERNRRQVDHWAHGNNTAAAQNAQNDQNRTKMTQNVDLAR